MKYILITGAYGGMGRATAKLLAEAGYFVFALDRKTGDEEQNIMPIETDVTDDASISRALQSVHEVTDELYAIIHFAGIYVLDSLVEADEEKFYSAFNINVFGAYRINKAFLPLLKPGSKIVITTSELAPLEPLPFTGLYAVTKGALDKYAYSLRMELQLLDISVTVLRPGAVKTTLLGDSTAELNKFCENTKLYTCNADRFKKIVESVESKNVPPEKIAKCVQKILKARHPKPLYKINRNPLLLLLNILPTRLQNRIIKWILK